MEIKPTVALRAMLVGGIAAFAKIAGAMKAAGGVKLGAAAAAMTAAATAAVAGSKKEQDTSKQPTNDKITSKLVLSNQSLQEDLTKQNLHARWQLEIWSEKMKHK
ncbi:hypothetical protein Ancab_015287 [Ancistrocladus abbreviatus]